ncbi:prolyl oligopeptidase family serine peptidase [Lutibacter sp. A80]|uniref:S9 family peptidase n=1 Tax=Lutibacter sp. A80 TaxID=2918453 RepID=UPI001F067A54|nr:prolyl oligopeptidase family serine peptidase [Lutibacter sp. A80]UMB60928.1 prolyl oligopeptidase family serine peptidase [Lutibacter sp. A80]
MKKTFLAIISLLLLFAVSIPLNAQEKNTKKDNTRWTPEDIINTESMRSVSISPDETMVVWTKNKAVKEKDKFVSDIYLTRLDLPEKNSFKTIQLTNANENDYSPIFSKDGEFIYFLSSREKGKKLWKLSIYGGEPKEVKEFKNGISSIAWLNKNTLLYKSNEGQTLYESQLKEKKDDVIVVEDSLHWKPSRVYAYNLKDKSIKRITDNKKPLESYTIAPNGKWLIYSTSRSRSYASDAQKDPFYFLKNLETNTVTQILKPLEFPSNRFNFSKDNKGFYFTSTHASDPKWNGAGISELYYYTLETNSYKKVDLEWELGIGRGYNLVGNDVIVTLANKAYYKLAYYKKNGNSWTKKSIDLDEKDNHTTLLNVSENGSKVIYQYSTASKLPKFYVADISKNKFSNEKEVVSLNKNLAKKTITKSEVLVWKGYNNEEVTGILYYPEKYEAGKRYPLILSIHGGPSGVDTDTWSERWSTYPNILAQRGAFVLKPNYHGSSNHGLSFVESIKGNYYEPELEDITKAINLLDEKGMIDKNQLGTMGWSNGAIITTMLTVRYPDMFKFAAPGAGDVNWTSDYGTCRFGVSFDQSYFGGAPWDDLNGKFYNENYINKSPLFEIEKIKTPTIIFHGSEDRAVPRDQGWEYYRGLQQVNKAPVRFLWFPGQPHGLGKITHQLRKMNEELAWIDTYLFKKPSTKNEAFKKESPLANLLKIDSVKITETGNFGDIKNANLIPETVVIKKDSIAIGRFEITNAQFKAYKPTFKFNAGLDNYPVVTSKEEALKYVAWLSKITGDTYRLPNAKEAEKLQKAAHKAAAKENTLNYWAGYSITIDEVEQLNQKVKELKSHLYKKVGKNKPTKIGEAFIYDLGGNVAEYFENGIYGYSAYDFYDANNSEMISSKHVGIRVIKE